MPRPLDVIVDALSAEIDAGAVAEGERLPSERALAERFGASRMSVREALLSLQAKGLIVIRNRARAEVRRADPAAVLHPLTGAAQSLLARPGGLSDLQEARILFECGLARHAARHASPKEVDRLGAALLRNRRAIGDAEQFVATDVGFHAVLAELPQNGIFATLAFGLADWLAEQRRISQRARGADRRAYRHHEAIFEAIAGHDPEAADKAMADHLTLGARIIGRHGG